MPMMDIHQILHYLPHRYPFLLIDRILELEAGHHITALKNVTYNEPYFSGHFPERPVMPGVILIEAMAQAAGVLAFVTQEHEDPREVSYFLAGVDNVRFKQIVYPGDQLEIALTIDRGRRDVWKLHGKASVSGHMVCHADIMLAGRKIK